MIRQTIAHFSKKERVVFIFSVIALVAGIFSGVVILSNRATTQVPRFGGTYREGIVGSPRFINPILATSDADRDLTALIYSGLVRLGEDGNIIPDLAESWDISEDGRTYTFHLKKNTTFHDGKALTAEDVVFTVSKITSPTFKSPLRVSWSGVVADATDDHTIVFTLQKPYSGFLNQAVLGILPAHIWKNIPDDSWSLSPYNTEPIGSGPYQFKTLDRTSRGIPQAYHLRAFKKFILGKPFIKEIVVICFANNEEALSAYRHTAINGLAGVEYREIASVTTKETEPITTSLPRVIGIFFNQTKNKIFSDPAVIRALNLAVDKSELVATLFEGYATPLNGPLPQSTDASPEDIASKRMLANKTLDAAGWKLNPKTGLREKMFGKETLVLTFSLTTVNTPELETSAQRIAEMYRDIGVHVDIKVFEIGTLNETIIKGRDFEALLFGQMIRHDTDLYAFWHSSQKIVPGLNITGYTNKRVDTLLESALRETDQGKRFAFYTSLTQELLKDAPVVFLYNPGFVYLMDSHVHHVRIPDITDTNNRLSLVYEWYILTDRVWNIFLK